MYTQEFAQVIDSYIELGYTYEDAYEMAQDDYRRGLYTEVYVEEVQTNYEPLGQETDKNSLLIDIMVSRGCTEGEAKAYKQAIDKYIASGQVEKATKIIARFAT